MIELYNQKIIYYPYLYTFIKYEKITKNKIFINFKNILIIYAYIINRILILVIRSMNYHNFKNAFFSL